MANIRDFLNAAPDAFESKNIIKLVRFGGDRGHPARGGTWYFVEIFEGYKPRFNVFGISHKVGWYRRKCKFTKPFLVDVSNAPTEGYYPLYMFKKLFGYIPSKKGFTDEKKFMKIECACAKELRKRGYDIVIFYYKGGSGYVPVEAFIPFNDPQCKAFRVKRR